MNFNNRLKTIDIMKGLLITLVVIGHLPYFAENSRTLTLIYSFHMPSFLIIAGMLSHIDKNSRFSSILIKRFKNNLIPYFVFNIITFFIVPITSSEQFYNAIKAMFYGIGNPVDSLNLPLWFLTLYFITMLTYETIELISYKIAHAIGIKKSNLFTSFFSLILVLILVCFSYQFQHSKGFNYKRLPFNIEVSMFCLLFVYFGKFIQLYILPLLFKIKKLGILKYILAFTFTVSIIILSILWYIFSMKNGRIDINGINYKNPFLMHVNAINGFIILSYISYLISKIPHLSNFISIIGQNSMYILAYHVPSAYVIYQHILPRLPIIIATTLSHNSIYSVMLFTTLAITLSLIACLIHKIIYEIIYQMYYKGYQNH